MSLCLGLAAPLERALQGLAAACALGAALADWGRMSLSPHGRRRLRLLSRLRARVHRFGSRRLAAQTLSFSLLFGIPALGLARFDLWAGHHRWLGAPAGTAQGLAGVLLSVAALYFATFLVNAFTGRLFCGWGCPLGQAAALEDQREAAGEAAQRRARLGAWGYRLLLASSLTSWWVDPAVLLSGDWPAMGLTLSGWGALVGLLTLHARRWRWAFCRGACPIGLYYSVVQTQHALGVHFDAASEVCRGCNACGTICPVGLDPRALGQVLGERGGLSIGGFPARNHCLSCGLCVEACELAVNRRPPLSLSMGAPSDAQGAEATKSPVRAA